MSGKQAHPLVPALSCAGAAPGLAGQSMMVAAALMELGAALIAFWIFHSGVPGAGPGGAASSLGGGASG
jgi:hypothetical protein